MRRLRRPGFSALALLLAVCLVALGYSFGSKSNVAQRADSANDYPLLSRRILSDNPKDPLINFTSLRTDIENYFQTNKLSGTLYFEYLPTGTEIRVNGEEKDGAASLLKVPLAMEFYKAVEQGKINPKETVSITADQLDSAFGELYQKGAGYTISLEDLAKTMLIQSDNTALKALADHMNNVLAPNDSVFNYLDLDIEQNTDNIKIGARSYSSVLKCLYFTCYLNKNDSQKILDYLTQTNFNDRLVAGVTDKTIKIAHKIGVFQSQTQSDCGIIYLPSRPYVLCVMIDGQDNDTTNDYIAEISKKVYTYLAKQ